MPRRYGLLLILGIVLEMAVPLAVASEDSAVAQLNDGFQNNDFTPLGQYLEAWRKKRGPASEATLAKKPKIEREAYAIFRAFFAPSKAITSKKYAVVQSDLRVTLVDDDLAEIFSKKGQFLQGDDGLSCPDDRLEKLPVISHLTLRDFRPPLSKEIPNVLYLTTTELGEMLEFMVGESAYESLYYTLTDRFWDVAHGTEIWDEGDATLMGRRQRLLYLNSKLSILPGHFGTGWHFETHPSVSLLYVSRDYRQAVALFRDGYAGGEAYLQKNDAGDWMVILRDENWDE